MAEEAQDTAATDGDLASSIAGILGGGSDRHLAPPGTNHEYWQQRKQAIDAEQETTEEVTEDAEGEPESVSDEEQPEQDAATEETEEVAETEEETYELPESWEELAKELEAPDDYIEKLKVKLSDGQETTIRELRDSGMRQQDYSRKTMALADERRKFEQQRESIQESFNVELAKVHQLASEIEKSLFNGEEERINQLRKDGDNEAYLIAKSELSDRKSNWSKVKNEVDHLISNAIANNQQQLNARMAETQKQEMDKLLSAMDSWQDTQTRTTEAQKIGKMLVESGFSTEEIKNLGSREGDHRLILIARDAMLYRQANEAGKEIPSKKKPRLVRRVRPKGQQKQESKAANSFSDKFAKMRKTPRGAQRQARAQELISQFLED